MALEKRKSTSIFFSDIVGYRSLMKVNEEEALGLLDKSRHFLKPLVESSGGEIIKEMGSSIMAIFPDVFQAVDCSVKIQRKLNAEGSFRLRIGLHHGEVIFKGSDIFGDGVQLAANIKSVANSGGIVISEAVFEKLKGQDDIELIYIGERKLKNYNLPRKFYSIKADGLELPEKSEDEIEILPHHNLPPDRAVFIGRQKEIQVIKNLILNNRLVTLTGSGGVGKTSLGLVAVREISDNFRDGVWMIELSGKRYMHEVVKAIAAELGIVEKGEKELLIRVTENFHNKNLLLFLDNCDTSTAICSDFVNFFLRKTENISVLITCKDSLNLPGEIIWRVPSMNFPEEKIHEAGWLENFDAVGLFINKAKAAKKNFEMNAYEAVNVGTICRYAEGIPLAIELIAGSLWKFDINDLSLRIKSKFEPLAKEKFKGAHRAKIVNAALEWSYELLKEEEKILLRRLSIFPGKFDLTSAIEICGIDPIEKGKVPELLSTLESRFLIYHLPQENGEGQFKMHLIIKSFCWEKLKGSTSLPELSESYFSFFHDTIKRSYSEQMIKGEEWIKWINHNSANINRIFELEEIEEPSKLHLAVYLGWYYCQDLHIEEGLYRLNQYFSRQPENDIFRARALQYLGMLYGLHGEMIEAGKRLYESVKIWKKIEKSWEYVLALMNAGLVTCATDAKTGIKLLKESLKEAEKIGNSQLVLQIRMHIAFAYLENDQSYKAEPILDSLIQDLKEEDDSAFILNIYLLKAACMVLHSKHEKSLDLFKKIVKISMDSRDINMLIVGLQGIAMSFAGMGKYENSFRIHGATLTKQQTARLPYQSADFWGRIKNNTIENARESLGIEKANEYENLGKEMGFKTAARSVLQ